MTAIRHLLEQQHHDEQAAARQHCFQSGRVDLQFADEVYLDHAPWIRPGFALLGNLADKAVLDYGCGHGMAATVLARQGAQVTGFDLSPGYVAEATERAAANQVTAHFRVANAEDLPFADAQFDAVWGGAILHHLDLAVAGAELRRVLKPQGIAVFAEPWGENVLLQLGRKYWPYPGKDRTPDEKPFIASDLQPLRLQFKSVDVYGYQLFGMLNRLFSRQPRPNTWLDRLDQRWINARASTRRWCRYVLIVLRK